MAREIRSVDEYNEFINSHKRCIIFYGSEDCHACTAVKGSYNKIAKRYFRRISLGYTDVNTCSLNISLIPLLVAYHKGVEIDRIVGTDKERLKEFIKDTIRFKPN